MKRDLAPLGALRGVSAAITLLALAVAPAYGQAPVFTKTLKKVNGITVTSAPASLNNGDILDWVITYQFGPNPAQPAQTNIKDLLPATLQYVAGSLQVPPTWTSQWFNGSTWVTSAPASASGVGAMVSFPQVTPLGTGQTALIPAPPIASFSTQGSGGDGYRAIPYNNNIYVVNHHTSGTYLDCFDAATGARCLGYATQTPLTAGLHVLITSGLPFNNNTSANDNTTSGKPIEYLDRVNGKLYFPVMSPPHDLGILCANLIAGTSCGFYPLWITLTDYKDISGIGAIGGRVYVQLRDGKIGCLDTTALIPIACAGQPYSVLAAYNGNVYYSSSEIIGTKIYSIWQAAPSTPPPFIFSCFDTQTNLLCSGWGGNPKNPDLAGVNGILYPLLSATGTVIGICVHTTNPATSTVFICYDPSTGVTLPYPTNYLTWVQKFSGGFWQDISAGQSGYYKARVFNDSCGLPLLPHTCSSNTIGCYDFAASGPCSEPNWPLTATTIVPLRHYTTIADPERPGCMWSYGDDGLLGSFEAADGSPCGSRTLVDTTVTPANSYCAGGDVSGWDKLSMAGLTLGAGVTATLTLYDGSNTTSLALKSDGTPYALNLPVTSLPLSLGGLGIGYGTGPGQYKSLRIVLQFNGVTNHTPWSNTPPPSVEVTWIGGGPPQFCFQTKVATCDGPVVTNQATAVTTSATGPPLNNVAPNPPFSAAHVLGAECPASLMVTKTVAGAPTGFSGTFKFNVTCSTPSGLLQQQLSLTWPSTTVTLAGIPVGSICTISEDPALPPLQAGYSWSGVPVSNPANGVIHLTNGGKNQISFANVIRACDDRGHVKITKNVLGVPPGFTGTFNFNVACWSGTILITQQAQIMVPGPASVTLNGIPIGSSCMVTEAGPLPALPSGWFWKSPSYAPPSGQVALIGNCCPEVVVLDEAKFCCSGYGGAAPFNPDTHP